MNNDREYQLWYETNEQRRRTQAADLVHLAATRRPRRLIRFGRHTV